MKYLNKLIEVDQIALKENTIQVFELQELDDQMLHEWANHFRQTFCPDDKIDILRHGTGLSRKDYLISLVFPNSGCGFAPGTRLADFSELLVADYLTYIHNFYIPKDRYIAKFNRNTSSQGTDVIGLKKVSHINSINDELIVIEVKAKAKNENDRKPVNRLQEAVNDVQKEKDEDKIGVTLNAIKHRALDKDNMNIVELVERFQNITDNPFTMKYGAVAVQDKALYDKTLVEQTIVENYVEFLLFINREQLMDLVNNLYDKAADIND